MQNLKKLSTKKKLLAYEFQHIIFTYFIWPLYKHDHSLTHFLLTEISCKITKKKKETKSKPIGKNNKEQFFIRVLQYVIERLSPLNQRRIIFNFPNKMYAME